MSETSPTLVKSSRRGLILFVVIVLALIALVVVHLWTQKKSAREAAPMGVTVASATLGSMLEILSELGTVTPTATVTVLPQLSGYLTAVGYQEGQDAQKRQFLVRQDEAAIHAATVVRLCPITMTTFAAVLGAVPLAIGIGIGRGASLRQPLGITVMGGLILSQVFTLYTTPVIYLYLDRLRFKLVKWSSGLPWNRQDEPMGPPAQSGQTDTKA